MKLELTFTRELTNHEMALVLGCVATDFAQHGMKSVMWPQKRNAKVRALYIPGTGQEVGKATLKL